MALCCGNVKAGFAVLVVALEQLGGAAEEEPDDGDVAAEARQVHGVVALGSNKENFLILKLNLTKTVLKR